MYSTLPYLPCGLTNNIALPVVSLSKDTPYPQKDIRCFAYATSLCYVLCGSLREDLENNGQEEPVRGSRKETKARFRAGDTLYESEMVYLGNILPFGCRLT